MTPSSGVSPRTRRLLSRTALGLLTGLTAVFAACADKPTDPGTPRAITPQAVALPTGVDGWQLTEGSPTEIESSGGAVGIWEFPTAYKVGTGLINPFLSIQDDGSEEGFNTNNGTPLDDKSGTKALALNHVPVIKHNHNGADGFYRQFILDANENNSTPSPQFSIDKFDVYVCDDPGAPNYIATGQFTSSGNKNCVRVYDLGAKTAFATDGLTSGSGKTLDYNILIPESAFLNAFGTLDVDPSQCPYMGPTAVPCGLWVIVHAHMGGYGDGWVTDATFEEFSTVKQPYVTVTKTATPTFKRTYEWDVEKSVTPASISLFSGESKDATYTVVLDQTGQADSDWTVTGEITIHNPSDGAVNITAVTDKLEPGDIQVTDVDCGGLPRSLSAGATLVCAYSYSFGTDDPNIPTPTTFHNTVMVELEGLAVASGESDDFAFTTPTTEVNKSVKVTDTYHGATDITTTLGENLTADKTFDAYKRTFTCDEDEGKHTNTAEVIGDNDVVLNSDDADVTVDCGNLSVDKTVQVDLERKYKWTIDKSVSPATWDLFTGDKGTSHYTIEVTRSTDTDKYTASGKITVSNSANLNATSVEVADCVQKSTDGGTTWSNAASCKTIVTGATVNANSSAEFNYSIDFAVDGNAIYRNHATVARGGTEAAKVDKALTIPTDPTSEVDENASLSDTYSEFGDAVTLTGSDTKTYDHTFTCDADKGSNENTATLTTNDTKTALTDKATVQVNCYKLSVSKTAETEWNRTWSWTIDKKVDPNGFLNGTYDESMNTATIQQNEVLEVLYAITLDPAADSTDQKVSGTITITNQNPARDATLTSVVDVVSTAINATVDCHLVTVVPKGGTLDCDYSTDLPNNDSRTNVATATLQNHEYAADNTAKNSGTTDFSNEPKAVTFAAAPNADTDECVTVSDVLKNGGVQVGDAVDAVPGSYCATEKGEVELLSVTRTFGGSGGIPVACGDNTFDNTATFTTNDTESTGSDPAQIKIHVACVQVCTLTQGYWKTHNDSFKLALNGKGPEPDPTWDLVPGGQKENTIFFLSQQTWFEVFNTSPQGNAYYNLAHQYMAAKLNVLAGAGPNTTVSNAITAAEELFAKYTPDYVDGQKGKKGNELRQQFIDLAGILGAFNEGQAGVDHCTENVSS